MAPRMSFPRLGFHWQNKERIYLQFKVAVFGSSRVGKTSIVRRILPTSTFVDEHIPTVEELHQVEFKTRNSDMTIMLDLLDTSGTYPFPAMRDLAIQTADAFILVYAVDDQESLDEICRLKEHILKLRGPNIPPLVVVANKIDLTESRVIDVNLIDSIISIDWEFGHVECSAKNDENVKRILSQLFRQKLINEARRMEKEKNVTNTATTMTNTNNNNSTHTSSSIDKGSESDPDISPSRSSISSEKLFFGDDFYGSCNSLNDSSRKNSLSDTDEFEYRLRNGFKNNNCTIS
ncbi:ras-related protein Rap-2b [Dermatophagoides farinae]|uniref:ras-related protein Rap-2b n=1 Tax=Dermatophagoides farinae TaxID=6954 RepID=UPI003F633C4F